MNTERLREALNAIEPYVEFYMKREIESPSNGEEGVREAREALRKFRAAREAALADSPAPRCPRCNEPRACYNCGFMFDEHLASAAPAPSSPVRGNDPEHFEGKPYKEKK
jgi:hypothetical protein